jgi:hypothetical protein
MMSSAAALPGETAPRSQLLADNKDAVATLKNNAAAAASASLFLYVIVSVLQQSDADLILPSSVFDLGGLLGNVKEGIPGGAFVAPLLQVKIPLALFYTLGPVVLLVFHAAVVLDPATLAVASPRSGGWRSGGLLRRASGEGWAFPVELKNGVNGSLLCYVAAPDGVSIELMQC